MTEKSLNPIPMPYVDGFRIKTKPGETIMFSYIVYKSRVHRDQVNAKVMKDPALAALMDPKNVPFDAKRML